MIVQALSELSIGTSYTATSLRMRARRDEAVAHLHRDHGMNVTLGPAVGGDSGSWDREQARSAWHLAADLVE